MVVSLLVRGDGPPPIRRRPAPDRTPQVMVMYSHPYTPQNDATVSNFEKSSSRRSLHCIIMLWVELLFLYLKTHFLLNIYSSIGLCLKLYMVSHTEFLFVYIRFY